MQFIGKIMGDPNKKDIKAIRPLIDKINALEPDMKKLSDEELAAKTAEFRSQLLLYLKGGLVLEDELVKLFREALQSVEPLAGKFTTAQLHAAVTEFRQSIERRRNPEQDLRDDLPTTLSECFETGYAQLAPTLDELRVKAAIELADERQEWPDEASDPRHAAISLLKDIEPDLEEVDPAFLNDAFDAAWPRFEEARDNASDKEEGANERLEQLLGDILAPLQDELVAIKAGAMDKLVPEMAKRYRTGKTLEDLLPEAFAVVRETGRRTIKMRHYDVQLIGGVVLHQGKIAEMKTGEGKTLVATLPVYLNALAGKGVHVVTVNDYLARRDADWMGEIYTFLGLTVGVIVNAIEPQTPERRAAYQADITYGTNNEFGFDYLRDNMVTALDQTVQRALTYAIVDEVDNILIDEARTPLIISGQGEESTDQYVQFARWAPRLRAETDYTIEEKTRTVILTEDGIEKLERLAGVKNIYDESNIDLTRYMENAIKAEIIFKRDKDYIVKDGEVVIVDEFTGRLMAGRRYSEGLHQAIEAKEGVKVQRENHTLATITFQNFFRLYKKLAGMTGTAITEAQKVAQAGRSGAVTIATNMAGRGTDILLGGNPVSYFDSILRKHAERVDYIRDIPETTEDERAEKEEAIRQYIESMTEEEKNELFEQKIRECEEDHEGVVALGGLHIIGTERHESRRIDNQLRGRAGRQGDPGQSRFFLALDDELMRRFAADRVAKVMEMVGMEEDMPLESAMVSRFIEQAQTKVEGYNFDIRKNVVDYDDVIARQREVIYADRRAVLERADMHERVLQMIRDEVSKVVDQCIPGNMVTEEEELEKLFSVMETWVHVPEELIPENINSARREDLKRKLIDLVIDHYEEQGSNIDKLRAENPGRQVETLRDLERIFTLQVLDRLWMDHIDALDVMRSGIGLRSYGQRDPLVEFKNEAYRMFENLKQLIQHYIVDALLKLLRFELKLAEQQPPAPKRRAPRNLRTNVDDIARTSGQAKTDSSEERHKVPAKYASGGSSRHNGRAGGNGRTPTAAPSPRPAVPAKIGRNDPCPCGSGKKYKKCHGA